MRSYGYENINLPINLKIPANNLIDLIEIAGRNGYGVEEFLEKFIIDLTDEPGEFKSSPTEKASKSLYTWLTQISQRGRKESSFLKYLMNCGDPMEVFFYLEEMQNEIYGMSLQQRVIGDPEGDKEIIRSRFLRIKDVYKRYKNGRRPMGFRAAIEEVETYGNMVSRLVNYGDPICLTQELWDYLDTLDVAQELKIRGRF